MIRKQYTREFKIEAVQLSEESDGPNYQVANYLLAGNPAPAGFLELARWWPKMTEEKRLAIEEMVLANWSARRLVVQCRCHRQRRQIPIPIQ
jgi:hypothetical protein